MYVLLFRILPPLKARPELWPEAEKVGPPYSSSRRLVADGGGGSGSDNGSSGSGSSVRWQPEFKEPETAAAPCTA